MSSLQASHCRLSVCHQLVRLHGELNHLHPLHLLQVRRRVPHNPRLAEPPLLLTARLPPSDLGVAECRFTLLTFSTAFNCCPLPRPICFQCRHRALKIFPAFKLKPGIYRWLWPPFGFKGFLWWRSDDSSILMSLCVSAKNDNLCISTFAACVCVTALKQAVWVAFLLVFFFLDITNLVNCWKKSNDLNLLDMELN